MGIATRAIEAARRGSSAPRKPVELKHCGAESRWRRIAWLPFPEVDGPQSRGPLATTTPRAGIVTKCVVDADTGEPSAVHVLVPTRQHQRMHRQHGRRCHQVVRASRRANRGQRR